MSGKDQPEWDKATQVRRAKFLAEHFAELAEDLERGTDLHPSYVDGLNRAWRAVNLGKNDRTVARMAWLGAVSSSNCFEPLNAMHKRAQGIPLNADEAAWLDDKEHSAYLLAEMFFAQGRAVVRIPTVEDRITVAKQTAKKFPEYAGALTDEQIAKACLLMDWEGGARKKKKDPYKWDALAQLFDEADLGGVTGETLKSEWDAWPH